MNLFHGDEEDWYVNVPYERLQKLRKGLAEILEIEDNLEDEELLELIKRRLNEKTN